VCISILVRFSVFIDGLMLTFANSMILERISGDMNMRQNDGRQYTLLQLSWVTIKSNTEIKIDSFQLMSVISLLSCDPPDCNSPANVDAAKDVRENIQGLCISNIALFHVENGL